jgi:isopenicillin-N N-acyltransferase like protein
VAGVGVRTVQTDAATPYERGVEFGQLCAAQIDQTWRHYVALWTAFGVTAEEMRSVGETVLGPVEDYSADLGIELLGMSAGCGLQPWQLGALNARTELLALGDQRLLELGRLPGEVTECSTFVQLPRDRAPLTAQTWDWHTPLRDSWCVWTLRLTSDQPGSRPGGRPGGRVVHTLTEYGILGKIGVASLDRPGQPRTGLLGLHFNALRHTSDTGVGGVPVHLVARRVLNEARTLDEAQAIARAARCTASAALTVTARRWPDGPWAACTVELHPGGPSVLDQSDEQADNHADNRADGLDGGCWLAHTNHFLADQVPAAAERASSESTTRERLERVATIARHPNGAATVDPQAVVEQLATHDLGPRTVCVHEDPDAPVGQRAATLAVAVGEPEAGRLHVHAGKPCEARPATWWSG